MATFDIVTLSSDDDEDVPLNAIGALHYVPVKSATLKKSSLEHCDFCEEVFLNKYDALTHNAKHIIIPLMKKELHQCPLCLFYYTSRYKLKHHTRNKHKNDVDKVNNGLIKPVSTDITRPADTKVIGKINAKEIKQNEKNNEKEVKSVIAEKKEKGNVKPVVKDKGKLNLKQDNDMLKYNSLSKDTSATKYESDDDLPLLNGGLKSKANANKETEKGAFNDKTELLRQALLKDVKVVVEKIEIELSPIKISPTLAVRNDLKMPDKIAVNNIVPKGNNIAKEPDIEDVIPSHHIGKDDKEVKMRNRLRFVDEVDNIDDAVMKDLTTECIVDMNLFNEPWFDELAKSLANEEVITGDEVVTGDDDTIIIDDDGDDETCQEELIEVEFTPSTHHDELVKPGVYRCKKCQQMFPTRFNQIQHEMIHMHIRKPRPVLCEFCDRFIATKKALKEHMTKRHRMHYRPRTFQSCTTCGLKYNNHEKHLENYHTAIPEPTSSGPLACHLCNRRFHNQIDQLNHIRGHLVKIKCHQCEFVATELEIKEHQKRFHKAASPSTAKNFNLCEVCCLFIKHRVAANRAQAQYVFGESVSKLGSRLDCDHCGNRFFHLTQVKHLVKGRPYEKKDERKKVLTNKERLKNIQQRLKMINKLSRF